MANAKKIAAKKQAAASAQRRNQAKASSRPIPYGDLEKAGAFNSTPDQVAGIKTTTPDQEQVLNNLYQTLPGGINNLNLPGSASRYISDKGSFAPVAQEARRNFSQRSLPGLAERFAGLGDSRMDSGSYQQAREGAIGDFESQLAALQAQHNLQEQHLQNQYGLQEQSLQSNNLFNSLGAFLHPQFDTTVVPGQESGVRKVWNGAQNALFDAAKGYVTGGVPGVAARGLSNAMKQPIANGTGAGQNSAGFSGVQKPAWQPTQNNLSTKQLASAGYPQLNDIFNKKPY